MSEPRRLLDLGVGDWVNERLLDHSSSGVRAGSVVPTGFERIVRVLHPAGARSWAQVAAEAGRVVHAHVQWCGIAPHYDGSGRSGDVDPEDGSVPEVTLAAILEHCPAEGDLVYAVWAGYAWWEDRGDQDAVMRGWGGRDYLLFSAPKAPLMNWPGMDNRWNQSANLIWPQDHSWCIATDIDWDSTLVAGTADVAGALLDDGRLEAYEVGYEDDLSWFGDRVNPRPTWLR